MQKLDRARIEAAKLKAVYDAGIVIVEQQRTTLKRLEKFANDYYNDLLKANNEVHKIQEQIQKELEQKTEENE